MKLAEGTSRLARSGIPQLEKLFCHSGSNRSDKSVEGGVKVILKTPSKQRKVKATLPILKKIPKVAL
jgi:hypothetical protein